MDPHSPIIADPIAPINNPPAANPTEPILPVTADHHHGASSGYTTKLEEIGAVAAIVAMAAVVINCPELFASLVGAAWLRGGGDINNKISDGLSDGSDNAMQLEKVEELGRAESSGEQQLDKSAIDWTMVSNPGF